MDGLVKKYRNKAEMKTHEDYPTTEEIVVMKDHKTTLHLLPDYTTDVD